MISLTLLTLATLALFTLNQRLFARLPAAPRPSRADARRPWPVAHRGALRERQQGAPAHDQHREQLGGRLERVGHDAPVGERDRGRGGAVDLADQSAAGERRWPSRAARRSSVCWSSMVAPGE